VEEELSCFRHSCDDVYDGAVKSWQEA